MPRDFSPVLVQNGCVGVDVGVDVEEGRAGGMNPPTACNLFWKTEEARRGL